ncbi:MULTISPECIES: hypothetical protein [Roseivirga]|jgi:hypothetical protein|uniref:Uncharacterized protein n=1 Tax=Roseivirga spongicola TaxID=333140 RepID=A0A150X5E2_9BACT|nr:MULTISPECIES: hypothetical protein [Roseivirga]PWL32077.1 MAG: hypothetical protein DCO95_02535 [Roseivirga sp. XM-24bin3]KYG73928.1 hypothetical protein AWW68_14775 [Roseivirga spongicola]MBO6494665.1 hypothetical protein [Roseivirga sp.]MBO6660224.1 hypothetical protein [Roseivirga sp.]MBO6762149.1 hypothetical protein [Roseivirga sp.]|tara:strand:- start:284 stop:706 length:423 start_codon:yes stop_codon:yes gene_type:complete
MDINKLNEDFAKIADKINELDELDYSDERYDDLEEELHDMEDDFIEEFGEYLEDAIEGVHDKFCPDNDVLLPIAYFAKNYIRNQKDHKGRYSYDIEYGEGVPVTVKQFGDQEVKLVLVPGPTRLIVTIGESAKQVAWKAD